MGLHIKTAGALEEGTALNIDKKNYREVIQDLKPY